MSKLTWQQEQTIDILLVCALFRCFNEQLYTVKGNHSQLLKLKFNRLLKVARQYDLEIQKHYEEDENIEAIYDELMELIVTIRESIIKSVENDKPEVK